MTVNELIAQLREIVDDYRRYGELDVRTEEGDRDSVKAISRVEIRDGYDESANGGGWDVTRVVIS